MRIHAINPGTPKMKRLPPTIVPSALHARQSEDSGPTASMPPAAVHRNARRLNGGMNPWPTATEPSLEKSHTRFDWSCVGVRLTAPFALTTTAELV